MEPNIKSCPNCGNQINEGALFCAKCGTKTDGSQPAAPVQPVAPAPANNKKKLAIIIGAAVLALIIVIVGIVAIAGGGERKFVGTWNATEYYDSYYGETYPIYEEVDYFNITFTKDGTWVGDQEGWIEVGTWTVSNGTVTLIDSYGDFLGTAEKSGGRLELNLYGDIIYFEKQ